MKHNCIVGRWSLVGLLIAATGSADVILVEDSVSRAPIVIYEDAPLLTRQSADELADYIEKTSGARPQVIEGQPDPVPEHAIWVGYQPILDKLFPKVDFDFQHPEEIVLAANDAHLVIAGRDRWDPEHTIAYDPRGRETPGRQLEYGTINAVYTFLQDKLGVRWLWPGKMGEDVLEQPAIAFAPFTHRYHPQVRSRSGLFKYSEFGDRVGYGRSHEWTRHQRVQLGSLDVPGNHAFGAWYERYYATHPEYFALQPDGTRFPPGNPHRAKLCQSTPAVWTQWLAEVEEQIENDPNTQVFNAAPNDGYSSGHCVCEHCRAWDHPDQELRTFHWRGLGMQYPAISDRHVTFANHCARRLKAQYPDKDYYASMLAYGFSRPAPIAAVPDDNVIMVSVANMFWSTNTVDGNSPVGTRHAEQFAGWAKVAKQLMWRPNTGNPAGWMNGLPDVPFERVMNSFRFAGDHAYMAIFIDGVWEHWPTTGPLYYLMAQAVWNPQFDWRATMDDWCRRAYGPGYPELKAYWELLEQARNRKVDAYPGERNGYAEVYDKAFFDRAYGLLDQAAQKVVNAPAKYAERIAFTRSGLDHTHLCAKLREVGKRMVAAQGADTEANASALELWDAIKANCDKYEYGVHWGPIRPGTRMARGALYHPDRLELAPAAPMPAPKQRQAASAADNALKLTSAEEGGWEPVFSDDFDRSRLGADWTAVDGTWEIRSGALCGSGVLVSSRGLPGGNAVGYQRMEFDAVTDLPDPTLSANSGGKGIRIGDLSSILHCGAPEAETPPMRSGYFFQFGGFWNTRNNLRRAGQTIATDESPDILITPGKVHRIVVQNDQGELGLFVDGTNVLAYNERASLLGNGQDHIGFYSYTAAKIDNVKVYVKHLTSGLDTEPAGN